ncbi:HAMP domain-containing sensor histidine kinase [Jeotgalicoccus meleagridis]|uniref:histidine kinase n=1 Tax=Jeotgalicoccus meleagridis TaxID=2759181 RepID=A0A6V7RIE4_9STAP|nr:ATP-binding protein [Jeotgalicoccus meleagridis]CAD2077810.1 Sensor protein SrrB [Jeotgalicoccus meleagridis]HIW39140.1 cell wall metabolism sensor histidine kinase WalK [Candidatus Jeotgalicoccus stercoravium]
MSFLSSVVTKLWFTILMIVTTVLIILSIVLSFFFRNYTLDITENQLEKEITRVETMVLNNHSLELQSSFLSAEKNLIIYSDGQVITGNKRMAEEINQEILNADNAVSTFIFNDAENREYMVKVHNLSDYFEKDTAVIMYSNLDDLNESFLTVLMILLISAITLFLLTTFFAFFLISRITEPLIALKNSAFSTARGKYNKLKVTSRDEIGELTLAFNKMNDNINNTISELTHEKNLRENVFSSLSNGILYLNKNAELIYTNQTGKKYYDIFDASNSSGYFASLVKSVVEDRSPHLERLDINNKHLQLAMSPVTSNGQINGVTVLVRDITDEINNEKMRSEFISNVSHELKTPMVMLSGYSEALLDDIVTDPKEVKEMIAIIKDESDRMNKLVNELLIIARMDSDEVQYNIEEQDLKPLINKLIHRYEFDLKDKATRLIVETDDEPFVFPFDADKLNQVLTNIIDNAIRYTKDEDTITISLNKSQDDTVEISIEDTGTGIKEENLQHIFDRFYKEDEARTRGKHGTGLGLYIVKNIIEKHGGSISVESEYGEGTKFIIKLPAKRRD